VPLLFNHDEAEPRGKAFMNQTQSGLYFRGDIANTQSGKELLTLIKTGSIDGVSIGFNVLSDFYKKTDEGIRTRFISQIELFEISIVVFPADPNARVSRPQSNNEIDAELSEMFEDYELNRLFARYRQ